MAVRAWPAYSLMVLLALVAQTLLSARADSPAPLPSPAPVARSLPPPEPVVKLIPLLSASFDDVVPLLQDELSAQGKISYFKARNALVVKDEPVRVERITALLASLDKPAANIRVEVEFLNAGMTKSSGGAVISDPRRPAVTVDHGRAQGPRETVVLTPEQSTTTTHNTTQFILARSGFPARLWVGETVREPVWLKQYRFAALRPGHGETTATEVEFEKQDVGASLYVTATYQDSGMIDIDLYPVVTYRDPLGASHALRVEQISTHVVARNGERVLIGGMDQAAKQFYRQFLGPTVWSKEASSESLSMYLTPFVRVMDRSAPVDHAAAPDGGRLPPPTVVR